MINDSAIMLATQTVLANGPLHRGNLECYLSTIAEFGSINQSSPQYVEVRTKLSRCLEQSIEYQVLNDSDNTTFSGNTISYV